MRTIRRGTGLGLLLIVASVAAFAAAAPAVAQETTPTTMSPEEVCASFPDNFDGFEGAERTCHFADDGRGITVSVNSPVQSQPPNTNTTPGLVLRALLWWLIPIFAGPYIAQRRGESIAIALVLTMFLGWIGLAVVFVFLQPRQRPGRQPLATP